MTHSQSAPRFDLSCISVGIDKAAFTFHATGARGAPEDWGNVRSSMPGRSSHTDSIDALVALDDQRSFHGVYMERPELGRSLARVECNPSRLAYPDSVQLVDVAGAIAECRECFDMMATRVTTEASFEDARLTRLDLAVDLVLNDKVAVLAYLAEAPQPARHKARIYVNSRRRTESVAATTKTMGTTIVYDLAERHPGAPVDVMRIEVQAKKKRLRQAGIRTFDDLTPEVVRTTFLKQAAWVFEALEAYAHGLQQSGMDSVRAALGAGHYRPREMRWFLGELVLRGSSLEQPMSTVETKRFREMARALGMYRLPDRWRTGSPGGP